MKKLLSILIALVLMISFGLMTAVPAGAQSGGLSVDSDGDLDFSLDDMDQHFSTTTIDASGGVTLSGSVALGNFDEGNVDDVWYEIGLVSNDTYLGYSSLHNKGVYMIALWADGYYKVHIQNVPGTTPTAQQTGNYLADSDPYPDLGWVDATEAYFKVPGASFDFEIAYTATDDTSGTVDLRISVDEGITWSGWKLYQYAEDDMENFYSMEHDDAIASGYAGDDDLTNARIVSQIFEYSTATTIFTADYDNIQVNEVAYELAPRVLNVDTGKGYTAIQLAIDAPETDTNDTISVAAGTYNEQV
ncbi:MAG: hypothetical protein KAV87_15235, partial [Desulfobacteraceae bacterium]|nr:hypothetical protein [Desulfobacteraceae bacterium]